MPPVAVIIGASKDRTKFGNKSLRAHLALGYEVIPVNPREAEIEGLKAHPDLSTISGPVDRVSMYVPPKVGITLLEQIKALKPREFFLNPGTESPELVARARELGLVPIEACSILALGTDPAAYP